MNVVHLLGRVITDPILEQSNSGRKICRFRLSTSNGKNVSPTRHYIVILGKDANDEHPANVHKLVLRGSRVQVSGRISEARWINKTTNQPHSRLEVIATSVEFVALNKENSENTNADD